MVSVNIVRFLVVFAAFWCGCCMNFASGKLNLSASHNIDYKRNYRIAIIGGGIGGTSVAYFLTELLAKKAAHRSGIDYQIDIYEQSNKIDDPYATIRFEDKEFDTSGRHFRERNRYVAKLTNTFGLKKISYNKRDIETCVFNGRQNVFCDNSWNLFTYTSKLFRYGLFDPNRMKRHVSTMLQQFERIYEEQENERAFEKVYELLAAMSPELLNLTRVAYHDLLENRYSISRRFVNEIAQAATLSSYGQTVSISGFAGFQSFADSVSPLWTVQGGSKQLSIHLAHHSKAKIRFNMKVSEITNIGNHEFRVDSIDLAAPEEEYRWHTSVYDYVIIGEPQTNGSDIRLLNFFSPPPPLLPFPLPQENGAMRKIFDQYQMQRTVATLVRGQLWSNYTNKEIISCDIDREGSFFTSLRPLTPVNERDNILPNVKSNVYEIISNSQLNTNNLKNLFRDIKFVRETIRHQPKLDQINQLFPPFKIFPGVYYVNAIEWAASGVEMTLIGSKNVALLLCHDIGLCGRNQINDVWGS